MIDATVWRKAADKEFFNLDPRTYGWSNDATSKKRDLPYKAAHTLDIARLVMPEGGGSSVLFWNPDEMPATLYQFLQRVSSPPSEARYTFRVRIDAENENARTRIVPVEFLFDPSRTDLSFLPFNTRYPWWRLWWWLRAQWSHWRARESRGAFTLACLVLLIIVLLIVWLPSALADPATSRSFYDRNGSFAGRSTTRGNATSFTDRNGRFDGTAINNSDGTTSLYDRNGHFTGSTVNTTPRR
jgi:hypothetical protein